MDCFPFLASARTSHRQKNISKVRNKMEQQQPQPRAAAAGRLPREILAARAAGLLCNTALVTETYFSHTAALN